MLAESVVKKFRIPLFCLITAFAAGSCLAQVVINEINYNSPNNPITTPPFLDAGDWFELYNPALTEVDVSGWEFDDNPNGAINNLPWVFPNGTTIPAEGYLVVMRNSTEFNQVHTDPSINKIGSFIFGLGSTDVVQLFDDNGALVDSVSYSSSGPWTDEPDGLGPTLSLIQPGLDNSAAANWTNALTDGGTPGAANGTSGVSPNETPSIAISSPTKHAFFTSSASISINTNVTDDGTIADVKFYSDDGTGATLIGTISSTPFTWIGWMPGDGTYTLSVVATDNLGATGTNTTPTVVTVTSNAHPLPLVVNEINYKSPDPLLGGPPGFEANDWIEIHNPNGAPQNVGGWRLRNEDFAISGIEFVLPSNIIVPAGGYLVIVKDEGKFNDVHTITNFVGEFEPILLTYGPQDVVELRDAFGAIVDRVAYKPNDSWPMEPNGEGPTLSLSDPSLDNELKTNWEKSSENGGTPGVGNGLDGNDAPTVTISSPSSGKVIVPGSSVTIEAAATDDGTVEQVQFFADANDGNGAQPIFLDSSPPFVFSGWIPTAGFQTITAVAQDNQGVYKTSESATINVTSSASPGLLINEINYNSPSDVIGQPVVDAGDWVEIYNPTAAAVNVGGWKLRDADPVNLPYILPINTIIPSLGYLVIFKDDAEFGGVHPSVSNKVGPFLFGLNGNDKVFLLDPSDAEIDAVDFDSSPPWISTPDGFGPTLSLIAQHLDNSKSANWTECANGGTPGIDNGKSGTTPNDQPYVVIIDPASAAHFTPGSTLSVKANSFDFSGGTITAVSLFADNGSGNQLVGTSTSIANPYVFPDWTPLAGNYSLTAEATDNIGAKSTSPVVSISVSSSASSAPLVITEINYSSPLSDDAGDWIELHNPTASTVSLLNWTIDDGNPAKIFTVPTAAQIPAGGYYVLVREFVDFRSVHPTVSRVFGDFAFGLSTGETIELRDPTGNLIDAVTYGTSGAWPTEPAGTGPTLSLIDPSLDNTNNPANWVASTSNLGTPAEPNDGPNDTDRDGMTDDYENANGLNPNVDDADGDLDGDGHTNIEEQAFGTAANVASSAVNPTTNPNSGGFVGVAWSSVVGKTYHIYGGASPVSSSMTLLRSVVASSTQSNELFADTGSPRFFFEVRVDQ